MKESRTIEEMIREVEAENLVGYGSWPLPCQMDDDISKIINAFLKATPTERQAIYGKVNSPFLFLAFSERMAILAVREKSEKRLFEGLIVHVIEDFRHDARENFIRLSLLYHSAAKLGLNPDDVFQRAATFATPQAAKYILDFVRRSPELKRIEAMRYREVMTPDGFSYEPIK